MNSKFFSRLLVCALAVWLARQANAQCVSLTSGAGLMYTQNFNGLATSGTTNVLGTAITGWAMSETGTSALANQQYGAGTGSSNAADTYSFGTAAAPTDRALGSLLSGTLSPIFGACFTNSTGTTITALALQYSGKQFRVGTISRTDRLDFQYSTTATGINTGTFTDVNTLDYVGPAGTTVGVVTSPPVAAIGPQSITGLTIASGATFWIRWVDSDASGADDGLAIDDLTLTATIPGGSSTNPSATATASNVTAGNATTFSGTISAGSNPTSASYTASCDFTSVGGSNAFALTVTGTALSGSYTVPGTTAGGNYLLPCTVTDDQSRSGNFNIGLTVTAPITLTCGAPTTLISTVQGSGSASPVTNTVVEIEGIVIGSYQGTSRLNGYYLQDEGDGNPATSDGIFIDESGTGGSQGAVAAGSLIRVRGTVAETFNQTVLNTLTAQATCSTDNALPTPADVSFPVATVTFLEQFEGMLVRFPQQLRVTDNFNLGRFSEVGLAFVPNYGNGITSYTRLMTGTQVAAPGAAANAASDLNTRSRIILDDGSNNTYGNLLPTATYPLDGGGLTFSNTLRLGDRVNFVSDVYTPVVGVMGFGFSAFRLQPVASAPITFNPSDNPRPVTAPAVGGRVRVMSANVLNYFTTFTSVSSSARGADNATEFARQREKIISAFQLANPAVVALSELENNASTAIADMVAGLNVGNPGKWDFINTGVVGTDQIRVAFLYQPALVQAIGVHKVLDSTVDSRALTTRNRPAIAQTFRLLSGGKPALQHFTVVANHFKSKGSACTSSPNDPNLNDGQDDCNLSRVSMAQAMMDWLATNPTADPTPAADRRFLIVGDLNAYLREDPLTALTSTAFSKAATAGFPSGFPANANATYRDLVSTLGDPAGYSYLFGAQSGALDHALANPPLFRLITGVADWHINADEPVVFDYNSDFGGNGGAASAFAKSVAQLAAYYNSGAFRTSDHDPLLVGFNPLCGDLNDDGVVDAADQNIMRNAIGKPLNTVDRRTDFDGDGRITIRDFSRWSSCAATYRR